MLLIKMRRRKSLRSEGFLRRPEESTSADSKPSSTSTPLWRRSMTTSSGIFYTIGYYSDRVLQERELGQIRIDVGVPGMQASHPFKQIPDLLQAKRKYIAALFDSQAGHGDARLCRQRLQRDWCGNRHPETQGGKARPPLGSRSESKSAPSHFRRKKKGASGHNWGSLASWWILPGTK